MAQVYGTDWQSKLNANLPDGGKHVAIAGDDSANKVDITTEKPEATGFMVQVFRAGVNIGLDVKASLENGVLTVEDGSTYKITTDDVIYWMVF